MKIGITERGDACFHPWINLHGCDGLILISKNIGMLMEQIDPFLYDKIILHATITGWGGTAIEPNVPMSGSMIEAFNKINFPQERLVLRVDPIVPSEFGVDNAIEVINKSRPDCRVRISFMDAYDHVRERMKDIDLISWDGFHAPLVRRQMFLEKIKEETGRTIEVCGEPDIECTGCVSALDLKALGLEADNNTSGWQRPACACIGIKKELLKEKTRCPHKCLYCYWKGD